MPQSAMMPGMSEGTSLSAPKSKKSATSAVDRLMEEASEHLVATRYFEAERAAAQALKLAHETHDYDRMARITLPLQEARRQKRLLAADTGKLVRVDSYELIDRFNRSSKNVTPGVYLLEPPLVGADGRDLRDRLDHLEMPAIVVVREPKTQLGQWPVVMIGPITVRVRIPAPKKDKPDIPWMLAAAEAMGEEALASLDPEYTSVERVEHLIMRLATLPDHEKLIQALGEACRGAVIEVAAGIDLAKKKARAKNPLALDDESPEDLEAELAEEEKKSSAKADDDED